MGIMAITWQQMTSQKPVVLLLHHSHITKDILEQFLVFFFFFFFFLQEVCYYIRDKVLKESLFFSDGSFVFFSEAT